MPLRLLELHIPEGRVAEAETLLKDFTMLGRWRDRPDGGLVQMRALLKAEDTAGALDLLEEMFSGADGFRVVLLPVEASVPRPDEDAEEGRAGEGGGEEKRPEISREELYEDVAGGMGVSRVYVAQVVLSSVVAAVGVLNDSVPVIIGAMVIAPLMGPNMALSLATTLGDMELARRALKTGAAGIALTLALSGALGFFLEVDPAMPQVADRVRVNLGDVVLSLASGSVAALSYTTAVPSALIGVMVAVALLPPLVVCGMLFGGGQWAEASHAGLLVLANLICINLAGVVTFLVQGVQPLRWCEAERAKMAVAKAIVVWGTLLAALVAVIALSRGRP